jgi:hypothetical protein
MENYLESSRKQFEYYKMLGEKAFEQISEEQIFWTPNETSNSIAVIVKHLSGNMLSRWTDFLTTDGEKEWRKRDEEFENSAKTKAAVLQMWQDAWTCFFNALDSITEADFEKTIYIRNMGHTIVEAINRQLAHYPYHIGQLVFLAKLMQDNSWKSLSIPKGKSKDYNQEKFAKPKRKTHFTDDL